MGGGAVTEARVNEVLLLQPGDELTLGFATDGARAYVCVQGGVDVPVVLGSRSTDVRAGLGGFAGRTLRVGDSLGRNVAVAVGEDGRSTGAALLPDLIQSVHDPLRSALQSEEDVDGDGGGGGGGGGNKIWNLRVLPGPGNPGDEESAGGVPAGEFQALLDGSYSVTPRSDRMAVCVSLEGGDEGDDEGDDEGGDKGGGGGEVGSSSALVGGQQMSEACVSGTVQLPPDGTPVILLAEHQTTGGYKVPAVVIQADLWQVGQMRPGDRMRFIETTMEGATAALAQLRRTARETQKRVISGNEIDLAALARGVNQMGHGMPMEHLQHIDLYETRARAEGNQDMRGLTSGAAPTPNTSYALTPRRGAEVGRIDLNADCGEGFDDAGLLQYVFIQALFLNMFLLVNEFRYCVYGNTK